jgi:phosphoserine phosphatase
LKGLPEATSQGLADRITPMPGGATLVATMKAHGAYAALVSGGFVSFSSVIAERLGFR